MYANEAYLRTILLIVSLLLAGVSVLTVDFFLKYKALHLTMTSTRAGKLLLKKQFFLVIASDEDYFLEAYYKIREGEMLKGTWTLEDEKSYNFWFKNILPQG